MANPTTAAEWKEVAANAQAQIGAVNQQKAQGEEQITALEQQLLANGQQISDYLKANPRITSKDSGLLALQAQTDTIKQNLAKTEVYVRATLTSQLFQLRATINNANTQAGVATTGAPNTNTNTPPETVVPDQSNTAVITETPPPIENTTSANTTDPNSDPNTNIGSEPVVENATPAFVTGQNAAADAAFLEANASEQQVIDPNSDPNTNIGNDSQEPVPQPQQEIGLNSDPNTNIGADIQTIENAAPATINADDAIEKARLEAEEINGEIPPRTEQDIFAAEGVTNAAGLQGKLENARAQQITQDAENAKTQGDWRVRLSLAPSAGYLYKAQNPGILAPLQKTDGVIFPYLPQIQVTYAAHYDPSDLTHSNYKIFQYKNSSVDQVSITCDFTAQDTEEANYMLAVIHFFRSVTKMFYGQDQIPKPGTPPPLCYLSGMGDFQFDRHPLAISSFNYSLPNDVDYIRASSPTLLSGVNSTGYNDNRNSDLTPSQVRMQSGTTHLNAGAKESAPNFSKATNTQPTYVPTKISISVMAYPIVTRNDISNNFSLEKYATGALLQGRKNPGGGGIW
jgi:hypothetical protein